MNALNTILRSSHLHFEFDFSWYKNPYFVVGPKTFRLSKVTAGFSPVPIVILTLEVLKSDWTSPSMETSFSAMQEKQAGDWGQWVQSLCLTAGEPKACMCVCVCVCVCVTVKIPHLDMLVWMFVYVVHGYL